MYRAIFLSDLHLGSPFSKSEKIFELLETIEAEKIFLLGDIINIFSSKEDSDVVRFIELLHSKPWEIIYISGNHEDERVKFPPISLSFDRNFFSKESHIYHSNNRNIYLNHGHSFHKKSGFNLLLSKSVIYIKYKILKIDRDRKEKRDINIPQKQNSYHRILKPLAQKLLKYSFREYMVSIAKENSCSVVICGHFHIPEDKIIKGIRYLNCGDWIENSSFIVEDMNGNFFLKR